MDFWDGMDVDEESGLDHLAHAFWGLGVLLYYTYHKEYKKFDDRVFSEGKREVVHRGTTKMTLEQRLPVEETDLQKTEPLEEGWYHTTPQHHASLLMHDEVPTAPDLVDMLVSKYPELKEFVKEAVDDELPSAKRMYAWASITAKLTKELEDAKEARRLAKDVDSCEERDGAPSYVPSVVRPECDSRSSTP